MSPTYEYQCFNCENKSEVSRPISKRDNTVICDKCGHNMIRLYTYSAFHLKGDGWYKTDYGNYKGHDPIESKKNRGTKIK